MVSVFSKAALEARRQNFWIFLRKMNFTFGWVYKNEFVDPAKVQSILMMEWRLSSSSQILFSLHVFLESPGEYVKEESWNVAKGVLCGKQMESSPSWWSRGGSGQQSMEQSFHRDSEGCKGQGGMAPRKLSSWWITQHGSNMSRGTHFCQNV